MRGLQWLGLGTIIGVAAAAVSFLLLSNEGRAVVERTSKAGDRVGEGVVDLLDTLSTGVERVTAVVGKGVKRTSGETRAQLDHLGHSARQTVQEVGQTLVPKG